MEKEKKFTNDTLREKFSRVEIKNNKHNANFELYVGTPAEGEEIISRLITNHYKDKQEKAEYWIRQLKKSIQERIPTDYSVFLYDDPNHEEKDSLSQSGWRIETYFKTSFKKDTMIAFSFRRDEPTSKEQEFPPRLKPLQEQRAEESRFKLLRDKIQDEILHAML